MSISFASLKTQLLNAVPARTFRTDSVTTPTDAQYAQCVADAISDFNRRAPMQSVHTIGIISGTSTYALPNDFVKLIRLASPINPTGVIISGQGIIPVNAATWKERHLIAGRTLTLYPTPQYSMARDVWYAAGHVLDEANEYPNLLEADAALVMLKAQSLALALQANAAGAQAWSYSVGDESVNKASLAPELREQAKQLDAQYITGIDKRSGAVGLRADYGPSEYGSFAE